MCRCYVAVLIVCLLFTVKNGVEEEKVPCATRLDSSECFGTTLPTSGSCFGVKRSAPSSCGSVGVEVAREELTCVEKEVVNPV